MVVVDLSNITLHKSIEKQRCNFLLEFSKMSTVEVFDIITIPSFRKI